MFKWLYYNSPTVQAACAILGIMGLAWYAWETYRIRTVTLRQSEASRRPFMDLILKSTDTTETFLLVNLGTGIALDVAWRFIDIKDATSMVSLGAFAQGMQKEVLLHGRMVSGAELVQHGGMRVEYSDTAEKKYWTTLICKHMAEDTLSTAVDTGEFD